MLFSACTQIIPTSIVDPQVLNIPIGDTHEPLVDLKHQTTIAYGPSPEIPNNQDYTKMRQGVYDRLVRAQESLPPGYKLCLYEGYRSLALQQHLFQKRSHMIERTHPRWTPEAIFHETVKLVSPVTNLDGSRNLPPHATGGAVDIYLIDIEGQAVDMGIHPRDWIHDHDGSLSTMASHKISKQAQEHRLVLSDALSKAGFVNYPNEYWHWSYGDRYWAFHEGKSEAIYGMASE